MSRVNLLPTDIKKGQEVRRRTLLVLIGAAAVIGLIIFFWVLQGVRLSGVNDDIEAQNQTNAALQQEIDDLQKYEDLQVEAQQQEQLLDAAYANEVAYSGDAARRVEGDPARHLPDARLRPLSTPTAGPRRLDPDIDDPTFVGTMTFSGATLHFESLSTWLNRLESVQGWANPWTSNVSAGGLGRRARSPFDTSVDLTQDALTRTRRGRSGGGRWITRAHRSSPPPARS